MTRTGRTFLVLTLLSSLITPAFAGPLSPPPGPVVSTAKPLSEIEPRIAVNAANTPGTTGSLFTISQPGSYYLTGNISIPSSKNWGISIEAPGVTLDLNGFTVDGNTNSVGGITISASAVTVRNGTITRTVYSGISSNLFPTGSPGTIIENIRVVSVSGPGIPPGGVGGSGSAGIFAGRGAIIRNCYVTDAPLGIAAGFNARISDCTVEFARQFGFHLQGGANISNCVAVGTLGGPTNGGTGFFLASGSSADNCLARSNTGLGFLVEDECSLSNCSSTNNSLSGFSISSRCRISDCTAASNSGFAISVSGGLWEIRDSSLILNTQGGINIAANSNQGRITSCSIRGLGIAAGFGIRVPTSSNDITINHNAFSFLNRGVELDGGFTLITNNTFNLVTAPAITSSNTTPNSSNIIAPIITSANISTATNPFSNTSQ